MIFNKQNLNLNVPFDSHLLNRGMDGDINRTFTGLQSGLNAFLPWDAMLHLYLFKFINYNTYTFMHCICICIYIYTFTDV